MKSLLVGLFLLVSSGEAWASAPVLLESGRCDRECLEDISTQYLQAMVDHAPDRLLWASDAHYTENGSVLRPGEGLWATASAIGSYRMAVMDPQKGVITLHVAMRENNELAMLGLRLRIVGRRIADAEHLVVRNPVIARAYEARGGPPALLNTVLPKSQRMSRSDMEAAAEAYFDGIEDVDASAIPFSSDCNRFENGQRTTNVKDLSNSPYAAPGADVWRQNFRLDCAAGINSGVFAFITEARDRRYVAYDEERGLIAAYVIFAHPGNIASVQVKGHGPVQFPPSAMRPFDTFLLEFFKMEGGKIRQIEAVIGSFPLRMRTGWEERR